MNPTTQALTADDLLKLSDSGRRHELVRGELRTMPPPGGDHGARTNYVNVPLAVYVEEHGLGVVLAAETGFLLQRDPDTVRGADVAFIRADRIPKAGLPTSYIPFAPDLAVDVVSPNDTMDEVEEKVAEWLAAGTRLVWVVLPRRRVVKVYRSPTAVAILTDQDEPDGGDVIPGFRLPLGRVFR